MTIDTKANSPSELKPRSAQTVFLHRRQTKAPRRSSALREQGWAGRGHPNQRAGRLIPARASTASHHPTGRAAWLHTWEAFLTRCSLTKVFRYSWGAVGSTYPLQAGPGAPTAGVPPSCPHQPNYLHLLSAAADCLLLMNPALLG